MFCEKCGGELRQENKLLVCQKCGAQYGLDYTGEDSTAITGVAIKPRGFSSKKYIIIIVIAALVVLGGIFAAVAVGVSHSASQGAGGFQLAEKYLSDQNYEQAIIAFEQLLEIEPMNVDAYLGLSDAYLGMGDTDKALEALRKGLEMTGDARIQAKIDELTKPKEPPVSSITSSSSKPVGSEPEFGSMGSVTILGEEYDIATTTRLDLDSKGITDGILKEIAPLILRLTNLEDLDLSGYQISDITPLAGLTNLTTLDLGWNQISDITPLAGLTNLTLLDLSDNQISDITPLAGLTNLTWLDLAYNEISDIKPLAGLTNLTGLYLQENQISDITPLARLTNLTRLWLQDNQISNIVPLAGLTNLTELWLGSNQISESDKAWLEERLPNCYIYSEF